MILLQTDIPSYLDAYHVILFLFIGLIVGFLSGLLGKGGSAMTTPALQIFAGVSPFLALASPLPSSLTNSLSGTLAYRKENMINKRVVITTIVLGIPATVGGSLLSPLIGGQLLMILTALFVCGLGVSFVAARLVRQKPTEMLAAVRPPGWKIVCIALLVGGLSGLLANGGGVLFAPLYIRWLKMPTKQAMASSMLVAGGLALPGTLTHWMLGHIDWWIVLWLSLASVPSAYLGARVAINLKNEVLELIFGAMLCLFGLYDLAYTLFLA